MSDAHARPALAVVVLSLISFAAYAHGSSRLKVVEKMEIDAPAANVWAVVGDFQNASWLPTVAGVEGTGGNTPEEAKRKLLMKNGGAIVESLTKYDPVAMVLSTRIEQVDVQVLPVTNYSSTISVIPNDDGKSIVEWKAAFFRGYPNNDPPPELTDEKAITAVTFICKNGLEALKAKLEGSH